VKSIVKAPMHRVVIGDQVLVNDSWYVVLDKIMVGDNGGKSNEYSVRLSLVSMDDRVDRLTYESGPFETMKRVEIGHSWD
jgi:hypothetical protein